MLIAESVKAEYKSKCAKYYSTSSVGWQSSWTAGTVPCHPLARHAQPPESGCPLPP
jgi:hypothetical protein